MKGQSLIRAGGATRAPASRQAQPAHVRFNSLKALRFLSLHLTCLQVVIGGLCSECSIKHVSMRLESP
jgi:hypothetical protein